MPIDEMFSQGSRYLGASRIVERVLNRRDWDDDHYNLNYWFLQHEAESIDKIMRVLAQHNWIRIADFSGLVLGSLPRPQRGYYYHEPAEPSGIDSPPLKQLNDILRSNTSIIELRLQTSEFTAAEFRELVEALKCNATIKKLVLHGRCDESDGVGEALVDLLHQVDGAGHRRHASVIESVILRGMEGTENKHGFCAALACNETLTSIELGNYFESDALVELLDAIERNPRIVSVEFDADHFEDDEEIVEAIERILQTRRRDLLAF